MKRKTTLRENKGLLYKRNVNNIYYNLLETYKKKQMNRKELSRRVIKILKGHPYSGN